MINRLKLLLKHLWLDASDTARAIPPDLLDRLARRVAASERRHSGEVRICVEAALPASYLWRLNGSHNLAAITRERAVAMFGKLRVWDTENNNGILIYLLLAEHAIEIVADRGVARQVSPAQWRTMVAHMASAFKERRYEDGLTLALEECSAVLMQHFEVAGTAQNASTSSNELPDSPQLL